MLLRRPDEHKEPQVVQTKENAERLWSNRGHVYSALAHRCETDIIDSDGLDVQAGMRKCGHAEHTERAPRLLHSRLEPINEDEG